MLDWISSDMERSSTTFEKTMEMSSLLETNARSTHKRTLFEINLNWDLEISIHDASVTMA